MLIVFAVWIALVSSGRIFAAGECATDPNPCFGPRSWIEDLEEDVLVASPDDWQRRNGNSAQPFYGNGQAFFDGQSAAWTLFDSMDHFFNGNTTVKIQMDENPGGPGDRGAGWWINADNEGLQGGFYPIYGVLARNGDGEQVYQFGQASNAALEEVVIADGPMEAEIFLLLPEDGSTTMDLVYTITDSDDQVHDGLVEVPGRDGTIDDKWLTFFSMADGQGVFEYIEVHNQPQDVEISCDFDGNGACELADIDQLVGGIVAGTTEAKFDINGDGSVNASDLDEWRSLAGTQNGLARPYLAADTNLDRVVDAGDLNNLGLSWSTSPNVWSGGDLNADGSVDAGDLNLVGLDWQEEVGLAAANASAVPEPNSFFMVLLLGVMGLTLRGRHS